jgi:DNA (cytosine-5)-methyltransferase 1
MKPRALDLFCCAGGATRGLQLAGFHVTGVDIRKQQRYCGDSFVQADAMEADLNGYDFIWASPPCQRYSMATPHDKRESHPDLLDPIRQRLLAQDTPWVIENVPGAPMRADIVLCGCQVGLKLRRKRFFETSWHAFSLVFACKHDEPVVSVVGQGTPSWVRKQLGYNPTIQQYRDAMGIHWMNRNELSEAIPPAYAEFIGRHALEYIRATNPAQEVCA